MGKTFINYPKKISLTYYDNARKDIINYFLNDPNIQSIYEYGTVRAPGVSDIDIMLIFKDIPNKVEKYNFKDINQNVFDLVVNGNVIKMTGTTFACLNYIDEFNFKLLSGEEIDQNLFPDRLKKIRDIISLCDWLPERIKRLEITLDSDLINISHTLCLLHSVTYSIKKVEKLTTQISSSNDLFELIQSLRENWWSLSNPEKLLEKALNLSIGVSLKAIDQITTILIKNIPTNLLNNNFKPAEISVPLHRGINLKFSNSLSYESYNSYLRNKEILFPGILGIHFANLANLPTLISKRLLLKIYNKITCPILDINNEYLNLLFVKASLISDNLTFLEKSKFKGGLIRYGFYA